MGIGRAAMTGQIEVRLHIADGCQISRGPQAKDEIRHFGSLSFGTSAPIWMQPLRAQMTGGDDLQVICSSGVKSFTVAIDGGRHGDRRLSNGVDKLAYHLYRDAAHAQPYLTNQPVSYVVSSAGMAVPIEIYAEIAPNNMRAISGGRYSDTLRVTLDF